MSQQTLPTIIQGGMGIAVSSNELAKQVADKLALEIEMKKKVAVKEKYSILKKKKNLKMVAF